MTKKQEENAVAVIQPSDFAIINTQDSAKMVAVIKENLGGQKLSFLNLDRVKIPGGGGTIWELEDEDGNVESSPAIEGVIIHIMDQRLYWKTSYDDSGGGAPPDCQSFDMIRGIGDPGGVCETCPYDEHGSGKDNSKACRECRMLFMMLPENRLPTCVSITPGSLKSLNKYMVKLVSKGTSRHTVITRLTLTREKSGGGKAFAMVNFSVAGRIKNPEDIAKIEAYRDGLMPIISMAGTAPVEPAPCDVVDRQQGLPVSQPVEDTASVDDNVAEAA